MRLALRPLPLALLVALAASAAAQDGARVAPPTIRALTRTDGTTHVVHTLPVRLGQRVVVTKTARGATNTLATLEPAPTAAAFAGRLGPRRADVFRAAETDNADAAYLWARTQPLSGRLVTFLYPEAAEALGRLALDADAAPGDRVTYRAQAVDDLGRTVGEPAEATVTISPFQPSAPADLEAERDGEGVTLRWRFPEGDDGVVQFHVYRVDASGRQRVRAETVLLRINNRDAYTTLVAVPEAEAAAFVVTAVDFAGQESAPSAEASVEAGNGRPPAPPEGVGAAARADGVAEVTWPVSTALGATGYHVYRAPHAAGPFTRLTEAPLPLLQTVFEDTPPAGRASFYAVSVVDAQGVEGEQSGAVVVTVEDRTPPPTPTDLVATPHADGSVALAWSHDPPADFLTYNVYRRRADRPGADVKLDDDALRQRAFVDRGALGELAEGARYRYAVVARDSARNASDSAAVVVALPDLTPPAAPSALAAQVDDALRATLRWDGTGDTDLGVYVVYRDGAEVGRTPAVRRLFRDADVAAGRSYTYAVAAVDTLGNEGPRSEPLAVLVGDPDPPRRVYNVRAERAAGGVALVWPAVPDADVAGYRVEGAIAPTGVFRAVGGLREGTAATVPTSAGPWFRVVAVDTSGNESGPSEAVRAE